MLKPDTDIRTLFGDYLASMGKHRTPERFAVVDAIAEMTGQFTIDMLNDALSASKFAVSRATLYNTLRLLISLNLIVRYRQGDRTLYERLSQVQNHCQQVCTICGKQTEVVLPAVEEAVANARLRRFRVRGFSMILYGICSSCRSKLPSKKDKK